MLLQIINKPTWSLKIFLLFIHIGAMIIIGFLKIAWFYQLIFLLSCLFSLFIYWRNLIFLHARYSIRQCYQRENDWELLFNGKSQVISAQLTKKIFCTRWLIILNFSMAEKTRSIFLLVPRDMLSADEYRKLQMFIFSLR